MKDQHTLIKGYRDLTQEEIDLINEIKQKGEELRQLVEKVREAVKDVPTVERHYDNPIAWVDWAEANYRSAQMCMVRAVARPGGF